MPKTIASLTRRVDFNSVLTLMCSAVILITLFWNRQLIGRVNEGVENNRATVRAVADADQKLILDFMSRTVDRWDKFQRDNPEIKVPRVAEPGSKPHLSDAEMERTSPRPVED